MIRIMYRAAFLTVVLATPPLAAATEDSDLPANLQEIVVTATRRQTKLLQTPISMTALGEQTPCDP
jgi:hypothetical protein